MLKIANVTQKEAAIYCRLLPLRTRRDISMLGVIHRCVLGRGPPQFRQFIKLSGKPPGRSTRLACARHKLQIEEMEPVQDYARRSLLGLLSIYNLLPAAVVEGSAKVSDFQSKLQNLVQERAMEGCANWADTLSPRLALAGHPLIAMLV